jgi:hypothetical protein
MPILAKEKNKLTRLAFDDLSEMAIGCDSELPDAVDYLDGNFRPYLLQAMADRYATEVVKTVDTINGNTIFNRLRSKAAAKAAISAGLFEAVCTYIYQRITRERATLFNFGAEYTYTPASGSIASDIEAARDQSGYVKAMQRADWLATGTGSAAIFVQVLGDTFSYQAVSRDKIWIAFDSLIYDGDLLRPVNHSRIEEASAIVMNLSGSNSEGKSKYVAFIGRNEEYPNGRMVTYWSNSWSDIPDLKDQNADNYLLDDGSVANPLTYWQGLQDDPALPEYPIIPWIGDTSSDGSEILPVDLGLFNQSKECDLAASRILTASLKSARGAWEFHKDPVASNVLPDCVDEGVVTTEAGQSIKTHSVPGSNSDTANGIVLSTMRNTAAAHGVPEYRLGLSGDTAIPSGVSLQIMNQPMMQDRARRIEMNAHNSSRIFTVEMALASMENGKPIGAGIVEEWTPNDPPLIEDPTMQQSTQAEAPQSRLLGARRNLV